MAGGGVPRTPSGGRSALLTDWYQLTMLKAYWEHGMHETAVFEFFVRRLPSNRNFLLAAGLAPALDYLEGLRFEPDELEWLGGQPGFPPAFVDWLADLRFTGDVDAMPEGTVFFPEEPLLRVTAPLPQAQLVETRLISLLNYASLIASKAVRFRLAAPAARLVDFGLRRAHGSEAGLLAARAAYIAGFDGTATALAGQRWGIPTFGTMAHSFVQTHDNEADAFIRFARAHPENTVLLIDTYDTEAGASKVVELAPRLRAEGIEIRGVRLDSGDLAAHARRVRRILDEGGCPGVRIFASSSLDEHDVARLVLRPDRWFRSGGRPHRFRGRADARQRLQAPGVRRPAAPQALGGEGDVARPQAGLPHPRRRSARGRCAGTRRRSGVRRGAAPARGARGSTTPAGSLAGRDPGARASLAGDAPGGTPGPRVGGPHRSRWNHQPACATWPGRSTARPASQAG